MILVCFGTRPEYIKIRPLISEFKSSGISHRLLFTGQHDDLLKSFGVSASTITIEQGDNIPDYLQNDRFTGRDKIQIKNLSLK